MKRWNKVQSPLPERGLATRHGTFLTHGPESSAISQFRLTRENTKEQHPPAQWDVYQSRH